MQSGVFHPLRVAVIGTGYVGLATGACLAYVGHDAVGVDKDADKVARLGKGESPIHQMEALETTVAAEASTSQLTNVVRLDRETDAPDYEGIGRLLFT